MLDWIMIKSWCNDDQQTPWFLNMNSHFFFVNAWHHYSAVAMIFVPFHSFQALELRFSISDLCKVQKEQKW